MNITITRNTNKDFVEKMKEKLKANDNYCPCSVIKSDDTQCMCKEFIDKKDSGWCHCGLYYKNVEE